MDASKAYVNAVFGGNESVSLLEMTRIQAQVLVPVLRALRAEIGVERANAIVITALREWSRDLFRKVGEQIEGSPRQRWEALNAASLPKIGGDIEFQP